MKIQTGLQEAKDLEGIGYGENRARAAEGIDEREAEVRRRKIF